MMNPLSGLFEASEWEVDALCAQTDPDAFFPTSHQSGAPARRVCAACPVRAECLALAMELEGTVNQDLRHGIWGGTTPGERAALAARGLGRTPPGE